MTLNTTLTPCTLLKSATCGEKCGLVLRFQIKLTDAAGKGFPESVRSKGRAWAWQDWIDWRGPLQPVAAILIETWIDRINRIAWFFILSILLIDVRQESKGRYG